MSGLLSRDDRCPSAGVAPRRRFAASRLVELAGDEIGRVAEAVPRQRILLAERRRDTGDIAEGRCEVKPRPPKTVRLGLVLDQQAQRAGMSLAIRDGERRLAIDGPGIGVLAALQKARDHARQLGPAGVDRVDQSGVSGCATAGLGIGVLGHRSSIGAGRMAGSVHCGLRCDADPSFPNECGAGAAPQPISLS